MVRGRWFSALDLVQNRGAWPQVRRYNATRSSSSSLDTASASWYGKSSAPSTSSASWPSTTRHRPRRSHNPTRWSSKTATRTSSATRPSLPSLVGMPDAANPGDQHGLVEERLATITAAARQTTRPPRSDREPAACGSQDPASSAARTSDTGRRVPWLVTSPSTDARGNAPPWRHRWPLCDRALRVWRGRVQVRGCVRGACALFPRQRGAQKDAEAWSSKSK